MRRGRRLLPLLLVPGALLAAWAAVALFLLVAAAPPQEQPAFTALLAEQAPVLFILWLAAAAVLAAGLYRLHDIFVAGPARLADATRVLAGDPAAPDIPPPGNAALDGLAGAINGLAARYRSLRRDMDERIAAASAAVAYQRDQLAALMAELEDGVIVCNLEGRILLYNQRSASLFAAHVGLDRSIDTLLDPALTAHAREAIEARGVGGPPARFVTGRPDGRFLQVGMAGVRAASDDAGTLTGYVLLIDDITGEHRAHADRDARLLALTEASRASLAAIQAALDLADYPDLDEEERARFQAIVRDEVAAMSGRVEALEADASRELKGRWPLQDMLGADFVAAAARRIGDLAGTEVETDAGPELWLKVDSFALLGALVFLASRYGAAANPPALRLRRAGARAHLDLLWRGDAADPAPGWQNEPIRLAGGRLPLSVRDVAERHGGEVWFSRRRDDGEAGGDDRFVRFLLPLATEAPQARPAGADSRPVYSDFDLFGASAGNRALDDQPLGAISYTVLDTETTGLDPAGGDEIIQVGAVRIVNGRLLEERFDRLVDPGRSIPEASIPIHGISPDMVRGQPPIAEILPAFRAFVADTVLVGHNVAFDMRFLQMKEAETGIRFDQPVLDTLLLASIAHPHEGSHGLEAVAARLGIDPASRHTALGDALTTAAIFLKLLPLLAEKGIVTLGQARAASANTPYARLTY